MPGFFAKRGTTMPPNINDDHSDAFSHGSTLKMEASSGSVDAQEHSRRPRASVLIGIALLFLLTGISVAAGVCYLNHMRTMDDIGRWVDNGRITPAIAAQDGLRERQLYSYGHHPSTNVTTSVIATTETTASLMPSFTESATGIPVAVSPMRPSVEFTITGTVTSENTYTVPPAIQSSFTHQNVTVTVGFNHTITISSDTPTLPPMTNTLTVSSTGTITETAPSEKVSTITQTNRQPTTVPVPSNSTLTTLTTSKITLTVPGTVIPIPASLITTATAAGVTGGPPVWTSSSVGWNSTISSNYVVPSASLGTVDSTVTASVNSSTSCTESLGSTASVSSSTSCTESLGSTVTSNDAVSATVTEPNTLSSVLSSSIVSPLSNTVIPTTRDPTSSTTTPVSQYTALTTDVIYTTTETETTKSSTVTATATVTIEVPKSSTTTESGHFSAQATTTTLSSTLTSFSTIVQTVTTTATTNLVSTHVGGTCVPAATVTVIATSIQTVTASHGSDQFSIAGISSMMRSSLTADPVFISNSPVVSASDIPLISVSPNTTVVISAPGVPFVSASDIPLVSVSPSTTVVISGPGHVTLSATTKTIISGMNVAPTDAVTASPSASSLIGGLMSHSISELNTSRSISSTTYAGPHHSVGTVPSIHGTGTASSVVYSTQTVVSKHTSTGIPIVSVSAGVKRGINGFGGSGGGNTQGAGTTCVVMLIAIAFMCLM